MTIQNKTLVTVSEAARVFGLDRITVKKMVEAGQIKAININVGRGKSKIWRIPVAELERLTEAKS